MKDHTEVQLTAPLSRLITEGVKGELLIYDIDRKLAHCLNPAAAVWKPSHGAKSIAEVTSRVKAQGEPIDLETVRAAIETLRRKHLLEGGVGGRTPYRPCPAAISSVVRAPCRWQSPCRP